MRPELGAMVLAAIVSACGTVDEPRDPSAGITPIVIEATRFERREGDGTVELPRPALVHFWATWCAPCRRELPSLLAAAREANLEDRVIAVSLDGRWTEVAAFFGSEVPRQVVREPLGTLARTMGVSTLPDTYLIEADGRATRRISHAIDWNLPAHRAWLVSRLGARTAPAVPRGR